MIREMNKGRPLYVRELGRYFQVVAIGDNVDEANGYMAARVPRVGVIAESEGLIFMSLIADGGIKQKPHDNGISTMGELAREGAFKNE